MSKVLLVEDDNNLREIYEARLLAEGYTITSAKDGEEALVVAKAEKPDLIISDVMMPKISGFEMLDILRNTEGLKETKVIMLTALGQSDDRTRADSLGADRYLVKSQVTLEDIVKAAHELLEPVAATTPSTTAAANEFSNPAAAGPVTPAPAPAPSYVPTPTIAVAQPPVQPAPETATPTAAAPTPASATPTPSFTPPAPASPIATPPVQQPVPQPPAQPTATPNVPSVAPSTPAPTPTYGLDTTPITIPDIPSVPDLSVTPPTPAPAAEPTATPTPVAAEPAAAPTPDPFLATPVFPEATEAATAIPAPATSGPATPSSTEMSPAGIEASADAKIESSSVAEEQNTIDEQINQFAQEPAAPGTPATTDGTAPNANTDQIMSDAIDKLIADTEPKLSSDVSAVEVSPTVTPGNATPITITPTATSAQLQPKAVPAQDDISDAVSVAHKKVISPINNPNAKPDLNALLAQEEAKSIITNPVATESATVSTDATTPTPPPAESGTAPASGPLPGNTFAPTPSETPNVPPKPSDSVDPNNIAL